MRCHLILPACALAVCVGCESNEVKHCQNLYAQAQTTVLGVQAASLESVSQALAAVESAQSACQTAGRRTEFEQLISARNQLRAQQSALEKRAGRKARTPETAEQIALLSKNGDPNCPKGQAYKHRSGGKEIRCTGPQPVEMSRKQAKDYYSARNFSIYTEDSPPTLKAEYGSERYVFTYADTRDTSFPKCFKFYPTPGMSADEAVARVTGISPQDLKQQTSVKTARGELSLKVENTQNKFLISIGDCG